MEILIISGFLGAGKTTFIKEMAKATGRDFCHSRKWIFRIGYWWRSTQKIRSKFAK